jgi:hypothetical protein
MVQVKCASNTARMRQRAPRTFRAIIASRARAVALGSSGLMLRGDGAGSCCAGTVEAWEMQHGGQKEGLKTWQPQPTNEHELI